MARPRIFPPGTERHVNLTMSEDDYRLLNKTAHDQKCSMSRLVRLWIAKMRNEYVRQT